MVPIKLPDICRCVWFVVKVNDGQAQLRRSLATMEQELQEVREEAEMRYSGLHGEQSEFLCIIRTVDANWGCTTLFKFAFN